MSKHNYLKKLEITNFRGLRDVSLDNLGLVNVWSGETMSAKQRF